MTMAEGYEPRWDINEQEGHQGALFVQWAIDAIKTGASVEIKTDLESWRTGNVYIEFECRVSGQWMPSGIDGHHTQSALWAHLVAGPMVVFAPTAFVRRVAEKYGRPRQCKRGSHPTRGKVLPIPQFTAAIISMSRAWAAGSASELPEPDRAAPFGINAEGVPWAPYGLNRDGRVRLQPGGRRSP